MKLTLQKGRKDLHNIPAYLARIGGDAEIVCECLFGIADFRILAAGAATSESGAR